MTIEFSFIYTDNSISNQEVETPTSETTPTSDQNEKLSDDFDELTDSLKLTYMRLYLKYEDKLRESLKTSATMTSISSSSFPSMQLYIEGEENEIIFNDELYDQLCETYLLYGWNGIVEIENALEERFSKRQEKELDFSTSGGIPETGNLPWLPAKKLFAHTKKIIGIMIRQALINIEKKSAEFIFTKLNQTSIELVTAMIKKYKFDPTVDKRGADSAGGSNTPLMLYRMLDKDLARELYTSLSKFITYRDQLNSTLMEIEQVRRRMSSNRNKIIQIESHGDYHGQLDSTREDVHKDEKTANQLETLEILIQRCITSVGEIIGKEHPLALLIAPALKNGFQQSEMENIFGHALVELLTIIENIAPGIDATRSNVEKLFPLLESESLDKNVSEFSMPTEGDAKVELSIEAFTIKNAMASLEKDNSFFPLLSKNVFDRLVNEDIIKKDSFEYVVCYHFVTELIKQESLIEEESEKESKIWKRISETAAALSLIAWLSIVGSAVASVLTGIAAIAGYMTLAQHINSQIKQIAEVDKLIKMKVVDSADVSTSLFSDIGELISIRSEYAEELANIVAVVTSVAVGSKIKLRLLQSALRLWGYESDIETLLE